MNVRTRRTSSYAGRLATVVMTRSSRPAASYLSSCGTVQVVVEVVMPPARFFAVAVSV